MAHILTDRVKETTTTTGTGAITLGGAVTGFQDFDSQMANADTTAYAIVHRTANEWEVGLGTWNTGNTLSRTTVIRSSNANAAVNLSAGTKDIFMTFTPSVRVPGMTYTGAITPATNDLAALGSSSLSWADLWLADGGGIVWNAGEVSLLHLNGNLILNNGILELEDALWVQGDVLGSGGTGAPVLPNGINLDNSGNIDGAAGSTSVPAIEINSTTLQTTPAAGGIERDATNFYGTTDAGNRGYIPVKHFIRADATRTYVSNTNSQPIFNSPANGRVTLEVGSYQFRGLFSWTAMSATSGNRSINILGAGTATVGTTKWIAIGFDGALGAAGAGSVSMMATVGSPASVVTATTATSLGVYIAGSFEITVAGTMIPSTTMVTAAASVLGISSWYEIERMGTTGVVSVGQWD